VTPRRADPGGMKIIPRFAHGVLDYVVGLLLIAAPWLFGFAEEAAAKYVPIALGTGAILYSLLTKYELGVVRVLPFRFHLGVDFLSGIFLAASPWLLGFSSRVSWPHLVFGLLEILVVLMTQQSRSVQAGRGGPSQPRFA